jgi:hypothetical protein
MPQMRAAQGDWFLGRKTLLPREGNTKNKASGTFMKSLAKKAPEGASSRREPVTKPSMNGFLPQ